MDQLFEFSSRHLPDRLIHPSQCHTLPQLPTHTLTYLLYILYSYIYSLLSIFYLIVTFFRKRLGFYHQCGACSRAELASSTFSDTEVLNWNCFFMSYVKRPLKKVTRILIDLFQPQLLQLAIICFTFWPPTCRSARCSHV